MRFQDIISFITWKWSNTSEVSITFPIQIPLPWIQLTVYVNSRYMDSFFLV